MGDLAQIKNHGVVVIDRLVLAGNCLGNAKNHRPAELKQQHPTPRLLEHSLLSRTQHNRIISTGDGTGCSDSPFLKRAEAFNR